MLHAGVANVDRCESDPVGSADVNVRGTALVAEACARRGARLVALSTDLVFAGPAPAAGIDETHPTGPLLGYGRTKLAGEEEALAGLCGERRGAHRPRVRPRIRPAGHVQRGRGLGLAPRAIGLGSSAISGERRSMPRPLPWPWPGCSTGRAKGRYHLGGPERVSRYDLGLRTAAAFGLSPENIEAVSQETLSLGEPRPADVSLDSSRARRELGFSPRPLDDMIRDGRPEGPPV